VYFCCVDGDHAYDGVKVNLRFLDEVGGFRLFDDSSVADFGVGRLVAEVAQDKKVQAHREKSRSKPPIQKENDEKGAPGPRPVTLWTQRQ
jgi:hypothetical protein